MPGASRRVRPARSSGRSSAAFTSSPTSATAAATASSRCPFGVIDRRPDDGRAFKCTFCYDRQKAGLQPACATACPTQSILFGELEELRVRADQRVAELHDRGVTDAVLYDPRETSVGGIHAMFIMRGDPEATTCPPDR